MFVFRFEEYWSRTASNIDNADFVLSYFFKTDCQITSRKLDAPLLVNQVSKMKFKVVPFASVSQR